MHIAGNQLDIAALNSCLIGQSSDTSGTPVQVSVPPTLQSILESESLAGTESNIGKDDNPYEEIHSETDGSDVSPSSQYETIFDGAVEVEILESNLDNDLPPSVFSLVAHRAEEVCVRSKRSMSLCDALLYNQSGGDNARSLLLGGRQRVRDVDYPKHRRRKSFDLLEPPSKSSQEPMAGSPPNALCRGDYGDALSDGSRLQSGDNTGISHL